MGDLPKHVWLYSKDYAVPICILLLLFPLGENIHSAFSTAEVYTGIAYIHSLLRIDRAFLHFQLLEVSTWSALWHVHSAFSTIEVSTQHFAVLVWVQGCTNMHKSAPTIPFAAPRLMIFIGRLQSGEFVIRRFCAGIGALARERSNSIWHVYGRSPNVEISGLAARLSWSLA